MNIQQAIKLIVSKKDLTEEQMLDVMNDIMTGKTTDSQIGGFLIGLAIKGESVQEITAAAKVMRAMANNVIVKDNNFLIDTCGTGGNGLNLFNISTACAFVTTAAGAKVAKHGNRAVSSKSGSADLLEEAGININISPENVSKCIEKIGIGFMFAPNHHNAVKHVINPRRELNTRTIFNILGPLTNPAKVPNQIIGVYDKKLVNPIANVLKSLGTKNAMVVHSYDGLDEISIAADTFVAELRNGKISNYTINPNDFGLELGNLEDIKIKDSKQSLALIKQALNGEKGTAKDIIALNAGAAIYVANIESSLQSGINNAIKILDNGLAYQKLNDLIKFSNKF
jgi:anthranilate phosphoribosyltransferase